MHMAICHFKGWEKCVLGYKHFQRLAVPSPWRSFLKSEWPVLVQLCGNKLAVQHHAEEELVASRGRCP